MSKTVKSLVTDAVVIGVAYAVCPALGAALVLVALGVWSCKVATH
jgi:hypothetical protein